MPHSQTPGGWLLDAFDRGGVDGKELSARAPDLVDRMLRDPAALTPDEVDRLLLECETLSGDASFGLHMIDYVDIAMMGTYGYLLVNAPTVAAMLQIAERYYPTFYRGSAVRSSISGAIGRFEYRTLGPTTVSQRHDNEWSLGFFVEFIRSRIGAAWNPACVTFTNEAPRDLDELHRVFGKEIAFGRSTTGFDFDPVILDYRVNDADPRLLKVLTDHAEVLLERALQEGSFAGQVRLQILEQLEGKDASAEVVARNLAVSLSSLKRKLQVERVSFRELRDDVIREVACHALRETDLPVGAIAVKLGYSESAAFNRAFRRLTGTTPLAFRRARLHAT